MQPVIRGGSEGKHIEVWMTTRRRAIQVFSLNSNTHLLIEVLY